MLNPNAPEFQCTYMELQSKLLKGGLYRGLYRGTTIGIIKGHTRSLDSGSHGATAANGGLRQAHSTPMPESL